MKTQWNKFDIKTIVTSSTACLFFVVGITGVLMFFHIFDDYTKITHEILALIFFLFSILHVIVNWKNFKKHLKKLTFITLGSVVLLFTLLLITISKHSGDIQHKFEERLLKSPILHSFIVLNKNFDQTKAKIERKGIMIGESNTIEEICLNNHISPEDLIELIIH